MTPNSSLLQWLATFQLSGAPAVELKNDAYYNLADGYVCARILNQISPQYFSDKWVDGIKPVAPNGSWRLRVSNLKRILQKIHDYASDLQSSQFMLGAINPDVTVIAQNFDPDQISRLIQLILFCAINCDKKQDFIQKIRDLPTEVKQDIKEAIEELLVKNDNEPQQSQLNTSQVGDDSAVDDGDDTSKNTSRRLNLSSASSTGLNSPARIGASRQVTRRDSSQSDIQRRNESGQLDVSSQSHDSESNENVEVMRRKLSEALKIVDQKAQSYHELEMLYKQVQLERNQLQYENEKLINDKNVSSPNVSSSRRRSSIAREQESSGVRPLDLSPEKAVPELIDDGQQMSQELMQAQSRRLQADIKRLERELNRVETEKEDFRLKSNLLSEDLDRITMKHEELKSRAEQAKRLQDELDEHKQITEKVMSYETTVENLVKKNSDMKKELKSLEEKNLAYIQKIVRLEQDNHQLESSMKQIEIYKRQLSEAHVKLSRETHRADTAEVDLARLSEKLEATRRENEKLFETTNQLMRSNTFKDRQGEVLALNKPFESVNLKDGSTSTKLGGDLDQEVDNAFISIPTPVMELKEKIARLEMENQLLEAKVNTKAEMNKSVLGDLLSEATEKCKNLEDENRQMRKKVLMLESNLRDLAQQGGLPSTSGTVPLQDCSSDNVMALIKKVEDLQRSLYQREQELRDAEARYKRNINKAKDALEALKNNQSISSSINPSCMSSVSFNSTSLDEANILRQQLREREERIIELEREFHEFRKLKEVHERLILTAFYGLTTPMQWKNAERRLERTTLTSPSNTANPAMGKNQ